MCIRDSPTSRPAQPLSSRLVVDSRERAFINPAAPRVADRPVVRSRHRRVIPNIHGGRVEPYADATLDAVAGAGGALLALLTTYPLMTLNTRQHTEHRARGKKGRRDASSASSPGGMIAELRQLIREEGGVSALYRGVEPAVIGTVASQAVYNYFYSAMRNAYVAKKRTNPGPLSNLAIASAAGCINVMCTIPIWTVTTRMQAARKKADEGATTSNSNSKKSRSLASSWSSWTKGKDGTNDAEGVGKGEGEMKGFVATAGEVWRDGGVAGFWQGVVPSLVMVSNPALQYALYETVADGYRRARRRRRRAKAGLGVGSVKSVNDELSAWEVFAAASVAKLGATVVTYPILLVKSRLQSQSKGTEPSMRYDGALDAIRRIAAEEGVGAFYRGFGTKATQTVFAAALMFAAKEEIAKAAQVAYAKIATRRATAAALRR